VVDFFIELRALRIAVEDEHFAEHRRAQNGDALKRRPAPIIELVDGVMVEFGRREFLDVPLRMFGFRHERRSPSSDVRAPAAGRGSAPGFPDGRRVLSPSSRQRNPCFELALLLGAGCEIATPDGDPSGVGHPGFVLVLGGFLGE